MKSPLQVLHLEDDANDAALVQSTLKAEGIACATTRVQSRDTFVAALERGGVDVILSDFSLPGFDGQSAAAIVRSRWPAIPLIFVSGSLGEERAIDSLKSGATDYVLKDRLARLAPAVRRAMQEVEARAERRRLEAQFIEAQKKEKEALLKAGALQSAIFNSANFSCIATDAKGVIQIFNVGAERMSGYTTAEVVNQFTPAELHDPQEMIARAAALSLEFGTPIAPGFEALVFKASRGIEDIYELTKVRKDGSRFPAVVSVTALRDPQDAIIGYLLLGTDNTARRQVEDERKQAEEQLKASFKEIGDLNTEIQNFYHTLSHELKTPLTSAREFVSIVMDGLAGPLNETQLEYLGIAKESCDQLRLYVNDLLDVTRLETGKMSVEFQPLPLAALVERVVEMLAPAGAGKGVRLSCACQPDLPAIPIDKQRILQVLTNLTTNAIKFTPAGGHICLSVSEASADPDCLQVDVRDTGRGIPKDQLALIFNRRYQANHNAQSVESRSGLGLGLYICQELVALHGGRIWVESEIGKGSTFSFVVPKQARTKGAHVLIADDDCGIRETLRLILEDHNFSVTTAAGGREALQLMGEKTPDVVVLDLKMAGLDGASTLKEIRTTWGFIPVIVYTGYPDSDLMRQAMESSPFTLLVKPCPPKRFVETIRRMCHTHETQFLKKNGRAASRRQDGAGETISPAKTHDTVNSSS